MAAGILIVKVNQARQVTELAGMSGNTFTVGKVAALGDGARGMLTLTPNGGSPIVVKLAGARQMGDLSALMGKTVTLNQSMLTGVGGGKWIVLEPVVTGAVKTTVGSTTTLIKLEGARQGMQAAALNGKSFTVVNPIMAKGAGTTVFLEPVGGGNIVAFKTANNMSLSSMMGKTVTIGKAPVVAGGKATGSFLALKPAGAIAGKTMVGSTLTTQAAVVVPGTKATFIQMSGTTSVKTATMTKAAVATKVAGGKTALASGAVVKTGGAKAVAAGGSSIFGGKSILAGLGLGLGIGTWAVVLIGAVGIVAVYGYARGQVEGK